MFAGIVFDIPGTALGPEVGVIFQAHTAKVGK